MMNKDKILESMVTAYMLSAHSGSKVSTLSAAAKKVRKIHMREAFKALIKELPVAPEITRTEGGGVLIEYKAGEYYDQLRAMGKD